MDAYIIIDYTNDFIHDKGELTLKEEGQAIEENVMAVAKKGLEKGDCVILAMDCHQKNEVGHPENTLFPSHNIVNTWGAQCYGQLGHWYNHHQDEVIWLNKRRYSAFYNTSLDDYLRERHIQTIYLAGVCTHICVLQTAIDAYNRGYRVMIVKDACASFSQTEHQWALRYMQDVLGATVI